MSHDESEWALVIQIKKCGFRGKECRSMESDIGSSVSW
jgi:hypothetical protein